MGEALTIIVVAVVGGEALRECANALRAQSSNLLLVDRDGMITDDKGRRVGTAERCNIPFKRKTAVELASTPLVGLIEDTVLAHDGWTSAIEAALANPNAVACGGPVAIDPALPAPSRALALSEYGAYNDRRAAGRTGALPGCNFAFRRDVLLDALAGEGLVDQLIFERLQRNGELVWAPEMRVTFCRPNDEGARLATRFQHGRIYASARGSNGYGGRAGAAAKALLLPAVLTLRSLRNAAPAERWSVATLAWMMLQHTAWAAGELTGSLLGPSAKGLSQWQ